MRKLTYTRIKAAADGKLEDGGELKLVKKGDGGKWVWRYQRLRRRREMGLGSYPTVSLADARKARDFWAGVLAGGQDPLDVRRAEQESQKELLDRDAPLLRNSSTWSSRQRRTGCEATEPEEGGGALSIRTSSHASARYAAPNRTDIKSTMP